jgi:predicted ATPase
LKKSQAALTRARRLPHPNTLAALGFFAAMLHQFRREFHLAQQQAEAVIVLAHEQEVPLWAPFADIVRGWALAMQGQWEEGIAQIQRGLAATQDMKSVVARPVYLAMLAEAHATAGQIETGLGVLAEALACVERTEERYYEAELHRLRGELLLRQAVTDASQAETCFQQALAVAKR